MHPACHLAFLKLAASESSLQPLALECDAAYVLNTPLVEERSVHLQTCRQHLWKMEALQQFFNTLAALSIPPVAMWCSPSHHKFAVLSISIITHDFSKTSGTFEGSFFPPVPFTIALSVRSVHPLQIINKKCGGSQGGMFLIQRCILHFAKAAGELLWGHNGGVTWVMENSKEKHEQYVQMTCSIMQPSASFQTFQQHNCGILIAVRQVNSFIKMIVCLRSPEENS